MKEEFQNYYEVCKPQLKTLFNKLFVCESGNQLHRYSVALILQLLDRAFLIKQEKQQKQTWNQLIQRVTDYYHDNYEEQASLDLLFDLMTNQILHIQGIQWQSPGKILPFQQQTQSQQSQYKTQTAHNQNQFQIQRKEETQLYVQPSALTITKNMQIKLKNIFQHFCMKVQHVGASPTFDKIAQECRVMTYGKLSMMFTAFGMFSDRLNPKLLNSTFNFITHSMKVLNFSQFKQILYELNSFVPAYEIISKFGIENHKIYKKRMNQLKIPITANKLAPVDSIQHKRIYQLVKVKNKSQKIKLMPSLQRNIPPKQKLNDKKKPPLQSNLSSVPNISKYINFQDQDDFYMREYKINSQSYKASSRVVQAVKKRADQQKSKQSKLRMY